jgi:hypothetical protein
MPATAAGVESPGGDNVPGRRRRDVAYFASGDTEQSLQPMPPVVVLLACIAPAIIAAVLLWVAFGPVGSRRRPFAPRSFAGPRHPQAAPVTTLSFASAPVVTLAPVQISAPIAPPPAAAPAPAPARAQGSAPVAAIAIEPPPSRPARAFDPALAPVVRSPRGADLPPMRRAARGTGAPPIIHDRDFVEEERTDQITLDADTVEAVDELDVDDLTFVQGS